MLYALSFTWNNPKGIDLGFITLHYYSLLWVAAFGLGWFIMKSIFVREGETIEKLDKLFMYTLIATMIGARMGHVIFYQSELFQQDFFSVFLPFSFNPKFEFTGFRGLASHGAAIGVVLAMVWYSRKVIHRPFLWVLDRVAIPVTSGGILIRIANFVNSEILGDETSKNIPTAVRFLRDDDFMSEGEVLKITGQTDVNKAYEMLATQPQFSHILEQIPFRHPAQLYEAFGYIFVFAIVYLMYWKTDARKKHGLIFGVFLTLLWAVRFAVEFVKQSQGGIEGENPLLSTGQWLSIPFILAGFYLVFTAKNRTETL
ncbi:prolipoprotein diacylglyceryl transferase [Flavobacterium sp. DG1-102-2]|uniref:prolipoprotein diacylglyceryl transferase n=1 Tax=Flavobacterium sp. DG1-102-2 TaxID=3081663 RepID=UPI00294A4CA5|nr:prolipoprotein diacylglyceryl transferase [Flavobacterium sp. DG1-102-2]MDV6168201.1 prolipoprotein diacylglyceryl transferase [Flavobacterium sp. DG1-102-2]